MTADETVRLPRERISGGRLEKGLTGSAGRRPAVVSNTERAMVMLLDGEDDPGAHAAGPGAEGRSGGFLLANGQRDEYRDADTVPLGEALRIVRHVLETGTPPPGVPWAVDR